MERATNQDQVSIVLFLSSPLRKPLTRLLDSLIVTLRVFLLGKECNQLFSLFLVPPIDQDCSMPVIDSEFDDFLPSPQYRQCPIRNQVIDDDPKIEDYEC